MPVSGENNIDLKKGKGTRKEQMSGRKENPYSIFLKLTEGKYGAKEDNAEGKPGPYQKKIDYELWRKQVYAPTIDKSEKPVKQAKQTLPDLPNIKKFKDSKKVAEEPAITYKFVEDSDSEVDSEDDEEEEEETTITEKISDKTDKVSDNSEIIALLQQQIALLQQQNILLQQKQTEQSEELSKLKESLTVQKQPVEEKQHTPEVPIEFVEPTTNLPKSQKNKLRKQKIRDKRAQKKAEKEAKAAKIIADAKEKKQQEKKARKKAGKELRRAAKSEKKQPIIETVSKSYMRGYQQKFTLKNNSNLPLMEFIHSQELKDKITEIIYKILEERKEILRIYLEAKMLLTKEGEKDREGDYGTHAQNIEHEGEIEDYVNEIIKELTGSVDRIMLEKSGWRLIRFTQVELNINPHNRLQSSGSSYIELPESLQVSKQCLINIKNTDNKCFKYSVICAILYQQGVKFPNPNRVSNYTKPEYENLCNFEGVNFPTNAKKTDINIFEKNNPNIIVNVFSCDNKTGAVRQYRTSKKDKTKDTIVVRLFLIDNSEEVDSMEGLSEVSEPEEIKQHYVVITNFSAFCVNADKHGHKKYPCDYCLRAFQSAESLEKHEIDCKANGYFAPVCMPNPGTFIKFKQHKYKFDRPFVVYGDYESLILRMMKIEKGEDDGNHLPLSYGLKIINRTGVDFDKSDLDIDPIFRVSHDPDELMRLFFQDLEYYRVSVQEILQEYSSRGRRCNKISVLSEEEKIAFQNATNCYICNISFSDPNNKKPKKVRDHNHFLPKNNYRGAACNDCNMNQNYGYRGNGRGFRKYILPIFFHNLRNYDAHLIIKHLKQEYIKYRYFDVSKREIVEKESQISVIANNTEKFMSFSFCDMQFIDSFQHLGFSLSTLASQLTEEQLIQTRLYNPKETHFQIAKEKGIFPYTWLDSYDKLKETSLPKMDDFRSDLTESGCTEEEWKIVESILSCMGFKNQKDFIECLNRNSLSEKQLTQMYEEHTLKLPTKDQSAFYCKLYDVATAKEDYDQAHKAWDVLECKTMEDYMLFYLKTDVLLLADVFENYRNTMLASHKLDPAHYVTLPSFSWDTFLNILQNNPDPNQPKKLELLHDSEMHNFFKKGIRGGNCGAVRRYVTANNKYLPDYDSKVDSNYLLYLDANALYAGIQCKFMPHSGFEWCDDKFTVDELNANPNLLTPDDIYTGYTLEVDLQVPRDPEIRKKLKYYPMAPENKSVKYSDLSDFQKKCISEKDHCTVPKLISDMTDKFQYVVHAQNLKYYLQFGYKITKIHRIVTYKQSDFIKPYIELNTKLRTASKFESDKAIYKLLGNSLFGKTMEDVSKRTDCKIIVGSKSQKKINADSRFERSISINDDVSVVQLKQKEIFFDKPIYIGQAILDLSKLHMYKFYYDEMMNKYGPQRVSLCYTDTDSLVLDIKTDDVYADMKDNINLYDTSDFPKDNIYNIPQKNKKVPLLFKDEMNGRVLKSLVANSAKMYSLEYDETLSEILNYSHKHKAKGISSTYTKKHLRHEDYLKCVLGENIPHAEFYKISSEKHQLKSEKVTKKSLDRNDSKRYICEDGIDTLPFGY